MALLEILNRAERVAVSQRFQLVSGVQEILKSYKAATRDIRARLLSTPKPGALYFSLREFPLEILLYAMARSTEERIRAQIVTFLRDLRTLKLSISGDDVMRLGLAQGPMVREALDRVLRARIDGEAPDREAQLKIAAGIVRELIPGSTSSTN